jgi:SAM-dependent methyltransferase
MEANASALTSLYKRFDFGSAFRNSAVMNRINPRLFIGVLFVWMWLASTISASAAQSPNAAIPYVPTRHDTVRDLLWLADVTTNDVVYDLGSGDGRVVIAAARDFHARHAVGIELDEQLVRESRSNAVAAGVSDRVEFIHGDLFTNDFSPASVVVLYLGHGANLDLREKIIRTLKPGTRVVSHQFSMGEWIKDKTLDVRTAFLGMYSERWNQFKTNPDVPDFDGSGSRYDHDTLSAWIVPAPIAGVWRGNVQTESGVRELKLTLHQRLSGSSGTFLITGPTNIQGGVGIDLWGDHLRCWCTTTKADWFQNQTWFEGHVQGNNLIGDLWMQHGTNFVQTQFTARRDQADFAGTWEWTGSSNAPVQLKIERRDGQWAVFYADQNREKNQWRDDTRPVAVPDFYDFGGGLYFTLLLGREGNSRRMGPQDGWLIGEAVMDEGTLKGTLTFYPYTDTFGLPQTPGTSTPPSNRLDWRPKRVAP